jgi:uncharacterized LabA/DUF88 family protein
MSQMKVGVYVDAENIKYNGGYNLRYDVLRRFAARNGGTLLRLNMYLAFDAERAKEDSDYARKSFNYQNTLRDYGWKVITKTVKRYTDEDGNVTTKANADLELAVDAMLQAENLDEILLLTGDGDFLTLVTALQNKGCRVELLGFNNVSRVLTRQVDACHSGFLIPDLVPVSYEPRNEWGNTGSVVRGYCSKWFPDKGYGFVNFIRQLSGNLWITDHREPDSPWESAFCHANELADDLSAEDMMNRDTLVEFYLKESDVEEGLVAQNVRRVQVQSR